MTELAPPPASLASGAPYPVPEGAELVFTYTRFTTDGWPMGDVRLRRPGDGAGQVIAHNVPARGTSRTATMLGDWARIFPQPLPVVPPVES